MAGRQGQEVGVGRLPVAIVPIGSRAEVISSGGKAFRPDQAAQTGKRCRCERGRTANQAGKLDDALRLYQHALQLDQSIGDDTASAQDWFAYGRFLDDSGFPPRLAYACLVKAESMTHSLPNAAPPSPVTATRQEIEKRLGSAAAAVRRDPEPALQEALALRR